MNEVKINDKTVAYHHIGNKESKKTIFFIHGATMTGAGLVPIAEALPEYNCIVVDLPAHGSSTGKLPKNVEGFADDMEQMIQILREKGEISEDLTIAGYSMGGGITCELAARNTTGMKRMIILSSGADLVENTPLIRDLEKKPPEEFKCDEFFQYLFGSDTSEAEKEAILEILGKTKVSDETGYGDLILAGAHNCLDKMSEVKLPALIINGDEDAIVLPGCGINLHNTLEGSQLVLIPRRGHSAIFEKIELTIGKIKEFIG